MHGWLATAAAHDRYVGASGAGRRTLAETYHWYQCTALFNQKLRQPLGPQDRDPLWATAACLGVLAFSSLDASTPEDAWPLKDSGRSDLEWIRMTEGKRAIWQLTDPLRPGGIFQSLSHVYAQMNSPLPAGGVDGVRPSLARLCGLDCSSTAATNPYFRAAHTLSRLQDLPEDQVELSRSLEFMTGMQPSFTALLKAKDPVALCLLALWYAKAHRAVWWISLRARVESQSICMYLQRHHGDYGAIHELLPSVLASGMC